MSSAAKIYIIIAVLSFFQFVAGQPALGQGRYRGRGGRRDDNRPMSNDEITQRMARTADFLKRADANGNGMIDPDEASDPNTKGLLDRIFSRMGKEPHYPMAISEIMQGYEAYHRSRGNASGGGTPSSSGGAPQGGASPAAVVTPPPNVGVAATVPPASGLTLSTSGGGSLNSSAANPVVLAVSGTAGTALTVASPSGPVVPSQASAAPPAGVSPPASSPADAKSSPRKPGRFLTARERLPKGLPDWFLEKDVNGEGQVTMAEFTDHWTPEKVAEFARYDLNHDGIITAAECLKVEKAKAK